MNRTHFRVSTKSIWQSPWLVAAMPLAFLSVTPAAALDSCIIRGDRAILGENWSATFDVKAGGGCMHGMQLQGSIANTEIAQRAQHGTVKLVDKATWTYEPSPGYRGTDEFSLKMSGQSLQETPGTSLIQFTVNVQ
jgi:hypothetical protein